MDAGVWRDAQAGCRQSRDLLIEQFTPLVSYVVGRIQGSFPAWVDSEDLISYGHLGLIDAIARFDPDRGIRFTTYAVRRIRGSILDELRKTDWAPRRLRPDARAVTQAHEALMGALGREPSPAEIASHLDWRIDKVERVLADAHRALLESLEGMEQSSGDDAEGGAYFIAGVARVESVGEERMVEVEAMQRLSQGLGLLDGNERTLLSLYYFEQMSFKAIADLLGVTESWVCQVYGRAMRNLRTLSTV